MGSSTSTRLRDTVLVGASLVAVVAAVRVLPEVKPELATTATAQTAETTSAAPSSAAPTPSAMMPALKLVDETCSFADAGLGDYVSARSALGAEVLVRKAAVAPDGSYDLLIHFHGALPVRRILAPLAKPLVVVSLDRGTTSGDYRGLFADRRAFEEFLSAVDKTVTDETGVKARVQRMAVSSFSAGYEAVRQVLTFAPDHPALTGVILLDSLYGSYRPGTRTVAEEGLAPFEAAARRALDQPRFAFLLTHSDVGTDGYATTGEVASTLLSNLVVRADRVTTDQSRGLVRVAHERGFVVRGYKGNDKGAHCAHLALLPELIDVWRSKL